MIISNFFITVLTLIQIKTITAAQVNNLVTIDITDTTSFILWYLIPTDARHEILRYHVQNNDVKMITEIPVISAPTSTGISIEDDIDGLTFLNRICEPEDWIAEAKNILNPSNRKFKLTTQLNLLVEIIKHAPVFTVQTILEKYSYAASILKFIKDENLTKLVLDSRSSSKEMKDLLLIFERYSNFNLTQLSVLTLVRDKAVDLDCCDLLIFTNEYPDVIEMSEKCSQALLMQCTNYLPKIWGKMMCTRPYQAKKICKRTDGVFVKFKLFSKPLLTRDWTLDMFALACEEFDVLLKFPEYLRSSTGTSCPKHTSGHIKKIEEMIPMIYLRCDREKILEHYGLNIQCEVVSSFEAPDENGVNQTIEVLLPTQQQQSNDKSIRCIKKSTTEPDTKIFVKEILSQFKTYNKPTLRAIN